MDLSNSVILPREDFVELQEAAWDKPLKTLSDRAADTTQGLIIYAGLAVITAGVVWGYTRLTDWSDRKFIAKVENEERKAKTTK